MAHRSFLMLYTGIAPGLCPFQKCYIVCCKIHHILTIQISPSNLITWLFLQLQPCSAAKYIIELTWSVLHLLLAMIELLKFCILHFVCRITWTIFAQNVIYWWPTLSDLKDSVIDNCDNRPTFGQLDFHYTKICDICCHFSIVKGSDICFCL